MTTFNPNDQPQEGPTNQPPEGDWLDHSRVHPLRKGQRPRTVTLHYPAIADFGEDAMRLVAELCDGEGFAGKRPWGFLIKHESEPENCLVMKPLAKEDERGVALTPDVEGPGYRLNLRATYQAYGIETMEGVKCHVPVATGNHPTHGAVLYYRLAKQTIEGIRRLGPRKKPRKPDNPTGA